jgi:N-glycosidase YbiA
MKEQKELLMPILFYSPREQPHGCFSNFSAHGFDLDGVWWPTSEHYYQTQKFIGTPYAEQVRQACSPREAANLGRRDVPPRPDWEQIKDDLMRWAVLRKFETHADIRAILLATGDEEIIENSPTDYYWGCGTDGSGRNMLGQILMQVRQVLHERAQSEQKS